MKVVAAAAATSGLVLAGAGVAVADSGVQGGSVGSPGTGSGNVAQLPVKAPINACGNATSTPGVLNPVFGNTCLNN